MISQETARDLLAACKLVMDLMERGVLVRDIRQDASPDWGIKMMNLVADLQKIQSAIYRAESENETVSGL